MRARYTTAAAVGAMLVALVGVGTAAARDWSGVGPQWLVAGAPGGCGAPTDAIPSRAYGLVTLHGRAAPQSVTVQVLRGVPNERYTVNVTCVGVIGDVYTDEDGRGSARITLPDDPRYALDGTRGIDVHLHCDGNGATCRPRWDVGARTQVLTPPA